VSVSVRAATPGLPIVRGTRAVLAAVAALVVVAPLAACGRINVPTVDEGAAAAPDAPPGTPTDARLVYASSRGPNGTSDLVLAERTCQ
jgi:hypothetical protein